MAACRRTSVACRDDGDLDVMLGDFVWTMVGDNITDCWLHTVDSAGESGSFHRHVQPPPVQLLTECHASSGVSG